MCLINTEHIIYMVYHPHTHMLPVGSDYEVGVVVIVFMSKTSQVVMATLVFIVTAVLLMLSNLWMFVWIEVTSITHMPPPSLSSNSSPAYHEPELFKSGMQCSRKS